MCAISIGMRLLVEVGNAIVDAMKIVSVVEVQENQLDNPCPHNTRSLIHLDNGDIVPSSDPVYTIMQKIKCAKAVKEASE